MNHLKSKKSRWSIWEFVDHIWIWEKFNNRRCIISTNIKASKRTLFGPLLCHRWASAERHKIQRRVMGTLAGTHLPKQGKQTPCIIVMHGSCRRDRSTAQRTKQPGHACNGHERTCIMYAPTHLTTKIWTQANYCKYDRRNRLDLQLLCVASHAKWHISRTCSS